MPDLGGFVVASSLVVDAGGVDALEQAFQDRLGEVEAHPGFRHLQVWRDSVAEGSYLMVTWWDDEPSFRSYMRSDRHDRSHERIPTEPSRARGAGLRRYTVVAT